MGGAAEIGGVRDRADTWIQSREHPRGNNLSDPKVDFACSRGENIKDRHLLRAEQALGVLLYNLEAVRSAE
jgi:hypothetical protein